MIYICTPFHALTPPPQGVSLLYMNNLSFILKAARHSHATSAHTILLPAVGSVARLLTGFTSDYLLVRHGISRGVFVVAPVLALMLVQVLMLTAYSSSAALYVCTSLTGAAFGMLWCCTPTIVSEEFGKSNFGLSWGNMILSSAVGGIAYSQMAGALYARHAFTDSDDNQQCLCV